VRRERGEERVDGGDERVVDGGGGDERVVDDGVGDDERVADGGGGDEGYKWVCII